MWDDILSVGSTFNWITPGLAFLQDLFAGPVAHFGVVASGGWYKRDVKRLLANNGIRSWGYLYTLSFDTLSFSVRKGDAERAYDILTAREVPLDSVPKAAVPHAQRKGWFE